MPKQINTHIPGQALVRMFGLKGRYQPVLDETIVPVVNVGLTANTEVRLATGGVIGVASGAGNQNNVFFDNPLGSGVLVKIKKFWATSGTPLTDFIVYILSHDGTGGNPGYWRDGRLAGLPKAGMTVSAAGWIVLFAPQFRLGTDSIVWEHEIILDPGDRLRFRQDIQNTTLNMGFDWTEENITATVGV